jgi:hypothetical protein
MHSPLERLIGVPSFSGARIMTKQQRVAAIVGTSVATIGAANAQPAPRLDDSVVVVRVQPLGRFQTRVPFSIEVVGGTVRRRTEPDSVSPRETAHTMRVLAPARLELSPGTHTVRIETERLDQSVRLIFERGVSPEESAMLIWGRAVLLRRIDGRYQIIPRALRVPTG